MTSQSGDILIKFFVLLVCISAIVAVGRLHTKDLKKSRQVAIDKYFKMRDGYYRASARLVFQRTFHHLYIKLDDDKLNGIFNNTNNLIR